MKKLLLITAFSLAGVGMAAAQSSGLGNSANDSTDGTNAGQVGDSTAAGAAAPPTATTTTTTTMPAASATTAAPMAVMAPQDFVDNAASGGMFEVQSSELALSRSQTPAVQEFAQMMITDHTAANKELKTIAEAKGLKVPTEIAGPPAQHMTAVQAAEGDSFDQTYMKHQAQAHQETIAMFEAEAQNGTDADLRAFAEKTLPVLKKHAEHIQGMMKQ